MKKSLSLFLSATLMAGLIALPTGALSQSQTDEMIQAVNALGIMVGDADGDMGLTRQVTRAEFTTMAVKSTVNGDSVNKPSSAPYPDVSRDHWSAPFVEQGVNLGLVVGYTDGKFHPDNQITLGEGVTIVLKVLGYTSQQFVGSYPDAQMALADRLSLNDDMAATDAYDTLTRQDAMILFYNMLTADTANSQPYLQTLNYPLTGAGEVDLVALINKAMDGPIIAEGDWENSIDFPISEATIYLDGKKIPMGTIQEYDVIYWSDHMKTLWVYDERVSGTIQSVLPNTSSPQSVQMAGQTYTIAPSASYALSSLGNYGAGDTAILLLGRDGTVVGVVDTDTTDSDRVGMITAINQGSYTGNGGSYTAETITILATDGKQYSYPVANNQYSKGNMVRISTKSGGGIAVSRASGGAVTGTVSDDGTTLDNISFADNVEILDVSTENATGIKIYPSRLAGISLNSGDVAYAQRNEDGEISHMILRDVTGDMNQYVLVTDVLEMSIGTNISSVYTILVDGQELVISIQGARYTTQEGPAKIVGNLSRPDNISTLKEVDIDYVSGNIATAEGEKYTLSDNVEIYQLVQYEYFSTNLDRLESEDVKLTGWYDKDPEDGGQIRMITAK